MSQNAVIYARFSSAEQAHGYSLERQISNGERYVAENGWTLEGTISDEGKSAFKGVNRSSGGALFQFEAEARDGLHRGKVLCVENIDRLSRQGAKVAAQMIWALNEHGVDVATWHDGITYRAGNNGDMMELFSVIVKSQLAYDESLKKSKRGLDSWQKKYQDIANGIPSPTSRPPAWIRKDGEGYALRDDRVKLLNEIYDRYIAGQGIIAIVQTLNSRNEPGWSPKYEGGWHQAYVHRLLKHRSVLGEYVTTDGRSLSSNFFPQAIKAEKFNQAQEVRATKKVVWSTDGRKANNLLTGMVLCNSCGGTAAYYNRGSNTSATYVTKAGEFRRYTGKKSERFCCDNRRRGRGCTNSLTYDYQTVEAAVLDALIDYIVEDESDPKLDAAREEIAEVQRQIEVEQGRLNNLIDAIADGGSKALMSRVTALESEIEAKRAALEILQRSLAKDETKPAAAADLDLLATLRQQINSDDIPLRNAARHQTNMALKRLIESVTISEHDGFALVTRWAYWEWDSKGKLTSYQPF